MKKNIIKSMSIIMSILLLMPFLESNCFLYFTNASSYNEELNEVICAN